MYIAMYCCILRNESGLWHTFSDKIFLENFLENSAIFLQKSEEGLRHFTVLFTTFSGIPKAASGRVFFFKLVKILANCPKSSFSI